MFRNLFKKKRVERPREKFYSSSEFVSAGHPDRLADNIASIIINDIQHTDGVNSHAAVEVFITHDTIYIAGEVKTTLDLSKEYLCSVVEKAFDRSGYISEMRNYWNKKEVMLASDFKIVNKMATQSPDIAVATTDREKHSGWNDQGIYFSSCESTNELGLGTSHLLAQRISDELFKHSRYQILNNIDTKFGPDNKVVVTVKVDEDGYTPLCVTAVTIAVSHSASSDADSVCNLARNIAIKVIRESRIPIAQSCEWIVNGTGRFVVHGPVSDTSMTGRKLSVNHPSAGPVWCNKMIGGGSLVKPWHASDLMLNIAARYIAEVVVRAGLTDYVVVGCSGAIGQKGLQSIFIKGDELFEQMDKSGIYSFFQYFVKWSPDGIADKFGFFEDSFDFGQAVNDNFFGHSSSQPWEDPVLVDMDAHALITYLSVLQQSQKKS